MKSALLSALLTTAHAALAGQLSREVEFNISSQRLAAGLSAFADQTGLQIISSGADVQGVITSGVIGKHSTEEALQELLRGTGLKYKVLDEHTVAIQSPQKVVGISSQPGLLRLSSAEDQAAVDAGGVDEVLVTAAPYRFLDADTSGTTNLPLPIEQVPQSITLLSADFMKAAGVNKVSAVDNYVAGVTDAGEQGGWSSGQFIRGFLATTYFSTFSRYVDGLAVPFDPPDLAFFDRIEVVKGPSSVTYGVATPGGLFNYVSKRAPRKFEAQFSGDVGSWDSRRIEVEAGGPINADGSLRAVGVGVYDAGGSFVHHVDQERTGGYAALEYSGSRGISGALRATHMKRSVTAFDGLLFYADGRRPAVSRGFFMGDPDRNDMDQDISMINGNIDWAATERLSFSAKASYQDTPLDTYLAYAYGAIAADGAYNMDGLYQEISLRTFSAALNGLWTFSAFGHEGSFLSVTATYLDFNRDIHRTFVDYHGAENAIANINEGEAGLYEKLSHWTLDNSSPARYIALGTKIKLLSAQTVVKATDRLSFLAGSSVSDPTQYNNTLTTALVTTNFDRQTSLRGGLTYEFLNRSNVYLSYSDSFEPQARLGTDLNLLPPLEAVQYEAGIKSRLGGGNLLLTAAVFRIEQKNAPAFVSYDPVVGTLFRPQGKVRHQGVELEASGQITPSVTVLAALNYLDAKVVADSNPDLVGTRRTYIPRQSASAFVVKGFESGPLQGFNVGGGIRFVGSELTTPDESTHKVDAYTVVDLIGGYRAPRWSAQLSLNNVFDEDYVQGNNYQTPFDGGNTIGQPRNVRLSFSYSFAGTH